MGLIGVGIENPVGMGVADSEIRNNRQSYVADALEMDRSGCGGSCTVGISGGLCLSVG